MQKIVCLFLLVGIVFSSSAQDNAKATAGLQFDGIYQSDSSRTDNIDNVHRWYLRFYANKTIVLKETFVEPKTLIKNFIPGNKYLSTGIYTINNNQLNCVFDMGKDILGNTWYLVGTGTVLSNGKIQLQIKTIATDYHTPPYHSTFSFLKIAAQ